MQQLLGPRVTGVEVLDIGAATEGEDHYQALVDAGIARVTGFEPAPDQFAKLTDRAGPYRYLPYFLGDGGRATFRSCRWPGCSSLLEPDAAVIELFSGIGSGEGGNFEVIGRSEVQTRRLDDIPEVAPPDYIKLDVQGAELMVLEHGTRTLSSALVVESEVEFVALYRAQPLFGNIQTFMHRHGFALHKLVNVHGRCFRPLTLRDPRESMSQMLWADAVFVRDFSRLGAWSDAGLLKGALILNDLYWSYDLAALLLAEYDRRTGSRLHASYCDLLRGSDLPLRYLNRGA